MSDMGEGRVQKLTIFVHILYVWPFRTSYINMSLYIHFVVHTPVICMDTIIIYRIFQSVEGENHERAVELLKAAHGSVKLVVRYTPRVLEEMEMRFDKQRASRRQQHTQLL